MSSIGEDESPEEMEPDKSSIDMMIDVDDLTQLPNINKQRERRLKLVGYDTLFEIAEATPRGLAEDAHIALNLAQQLSDTAKTLLKRRKHPLAS